MPHFWQVLPEVRGCCDPAFPIGGKTTDFSVGMTDHYSYEHSHEAWHCSERRKMSCAAQQLPYVEKMQNGSRILRLTGNAVDSLQFRMNGVCCFVRLPS